MVLRPGRALPRRAASALLLAVAAVAAAPAPAAAWTTRGHRLVARLGEARLTPAARARARALLTGAHLADASMWADGEVRRDPSTGPWHYVNIGAGDGGYDAARHCPTGDCVVARVESFARELADRGLPDEQRSRALRFVVHLVADLHQPLHAGRPEDRGGNRILVAAPDGGEAVKLHLVYDALPDACAGPRRERDAVRALAAAIDPEEARAWAASSPAEWATESHLLSGHVYAALAPAGGEGLVALRGRPDVRCALVRTQLAKAGVRLGAVLERALGDAGRGG